MNVVSDWKLIISKKINILRSSSDELERSKLSFSIRSDLEILRVSISDLNAGDREVGVTSEEVYKFLFREWIQATHPYQRREMDSNVDLFERASQPKNRESTPSLRRSRKVSRNPQRQCRDSVRHTVQ